ncbi:MAG: acetyl-CoA carboxylase, carboxyltransferase subunit beta [Gemmatimonadales bacterium]|jgi:acetyl-CoA carboxylase carboxyl transferase subunit beta|nr:acetyl-CoA carboxylase, carboxyltransferase subunit beta [Gemmatimonadales bacterium]MDZ4390577.1 acetyl-CoA carboxylase, carboxyltransferase subunit beta [Gemmatimonadales bacterium]
MTVMAWFKKERKLKTASRERREMPADAWEKCESCGHIDIREKFERALNVCPECGTHKRFSAEEYIELLTDEGSWKELFAGLTSVDPLEFEHYADRLAAARKKAGSSDAIYTGMARIEKRRMHLGVMNFRFMGGSMGSVVGEKIARLARRSAVKKIPMVLVCTSGGARMQEGALSLMQMAKTSAAIAQMKQAAVPFITILTDPTTGGVSASFAMQGDVILAEPAAVIGFAGQRVIKQTIGQDLPEGFQTAEFLLEKGQIDDVVPRASLRETLARLLRHMQQQRLPSAGAAA